MNAVAILAVAFVTLSACSNSDPKESEKGSGADTSLMRSPKTQGQWRGLLTISPDLKALDTTTSLSQVCSDLYRSYLSHKDRKIVETSCPLSELITTMSRGSIEEGIQKIDRSMSSLPSVGKERDQNKLKSFDMVVTVEMSSDDGIVGGILSGFRSRSSERADVCYLYNDHTQSLFVIHIDEFEIDEYVMRTDSMASGVSVFVFNDSLQLTDFVSRSTITFDLKLCSFVREGDRIRRLDSLVPYASDPLQMTIGSCFSYASLLTMEGSERSYWDDDLSYRMNWYVQVIENSELDCQ